MTRRFGSISCLVYDNGRPDKTRVSLSEIMTDRLMLPIADAGVTSDYECMGSNLDYTTGLSVPTVVSCIQPCASPVVPVQSNPSPNFCYYVYSGAFFERVVSYLAFLPNYIQENMSGWTDYNFCSPDIINSEGVCPTSFLAPAKTLKGCRPDGKGVWSLPPGESSCLLFLNGHDWPVGATFLIAATSVVGTSGLLGLGGLAGINAMSSCPSPTSAYCRAGGRCCLLIPTINGPVCPDSCPP